jgi:outer membrane protein assembly factor BamB
MKTHFILIFISVFALASSVAGEDWPAWRGATGTGIAPQQSEPPIEWSEDENVLWKVEIPGRGHGSPTIVGNRIYLASADEALRTQFVMALDRESGEILWQTTVYETSEWPAIHPKNTHASATVACQGDSLFITFYSDAKIRVASLSTAGEVKWKKDVADFDQKYPFGYAASPIPYKETIIVGAESEAETVLVAYKQADGEEVWRSDRPKNSSYSSPIVLDVGGREQLLMNGGQEIRAYDPATGKELWEVEGSAKHTAGTVTGEGDLVVASGGYPQSETCCINAKSGELVWRNKQKCYEQSVVIADGFVYALNDGGIAFCWDAQTGKEQWKKRLAGPVSASPVLVGDRIYASNELGETFVFKATPEKYEELAVNRLGDDSFPTPTFLDGRAYIRVGFGTADERYEMLYCIGADES